MARPIAVLQLTPEDRSELQRRVRAPTTSQRDGLRARIVLLRGEGLKQKDVAEKLATSVTTVSLWSQRFGRDGFEGLRDKPGRGRKPWLPVEKIQKVITQVTQPPKGRRRWSVRTMAKAVGISHDSVHRIWRQNDLKPHLRRTFKLSQDPEFERKFWDVIGLYLNPPDKALVLCCDEKSQCQALERTQPGLPLGIGHIRTRTHDYIRLGVKVADPPHGTDDEERRAEGHPPGCSRRFASGNADKLGMLPRRSNSVCIFTAALCRRNLAQGNSEIESRA